MVLTPYLLGRYGHEEMSYHPLEQFERIDPALTVLAEKNLNETFSH